LMITSTANERVRLARSLNQASGRRRERAYLVEGVRLVEEVLRAGIAPRLTLVDVEAMRQTDRGDALLEALGSAAGYLEASEKVLASVSEMVTPQGVVAVVPLPEYHLPQDAGPLVLILDGVRDPGNLGTILRAAEATGIVRVVAAVGCVDPFGPKAVRAGMGAHFHLDVLAEADWADVARLVGDRPTWLATMRGGMLYDMVDWGLDSALIVGGEAAGASGEAAALATGLVSIPMAGRAESLNAAMAASVLVFEAARQRR
jgi:RNA methyltransferase, TrmH family